MIPTTEAGAAGRWYQVPLMWFVLGVPLLTVVAGLSMVVVASRGADAVVTDDFRKDGLAINRDPTRDRAAARLGVAATVDAAEGRLAVRLAPGAAESPARLVVVLSHATRAELDRLVELERQPEDVYVGPLRALEPGHWYVEVSPADRGWRLTGDFRDGARDLPLRPRAE